MSTSIRLARAFSRLGITLSYADGIYHLSTPESAARVLLPHDLPLEEKAVQQLLAFAGVRSPDGSRRVCGACATPDFHPGNLAPVGTIVATPEDFVIPASIGTDINCGMRLVRTGVRVDDFRAQEQRLIAPLSRALLEGARNVPLREESFLALFDAGPAALLEHLRAERRHAIPGLYSQGSLWARADLERIRREVAACIGLSSFRGSATHAPDYLVGAGPGSGRRRRDVVRDPGLGTVGSGNHFVEFACISQVLDRRTAWEQGLRPDEVVFMVHSGSRVVGKHVGVRWMDRARAAWPQGMPHPAHGLYGLQGSEARSYLQAMGTASLYAWLNRVVLTEMVRIPLAEVFGRDATALIVDVPHNVVLQEPQGLGTGRGEDPQPAGALLNIHRKGATPAHAGDLALIPGSMGTASYLVKGLGHPDWFASCSHGAGRSVRRQVMHRDPRTGPEESRTWRCVTLREERRIEEAPEAYKPIGAVLSAQEHAGLLQPVVELSPLLTFKA